MKSRFLIAAAVFGLGLLGCTSITPEAKRALERPVDCSSARRDMATLEAERASVAKQLGAGVASVMPVSAVVNILRGTYRDGLQVATGSYNADLEAKQREISQACGVPIPAR